MGRIQWGFKQAKKAKKAVKHISRTIKKGVKDIKKAYKENVSNEGGSMDPAEARRLRHIFNSTNYGMDRAKEILGKEGYNLDEELSRSHGDEGTTGLVFTDKDGKPHVVHNRSQTRNDFGWADPAIFLGRGKKTDRFKRAKALQEAAEQKYGRKDIDTYGHSLGGWLAANVGTEGQVTTFNRVSTIGGEDWAGKRDNLRDIRTSNDLPSMFIGDHKGREVIQGRGDALTTHVGWALKEHEYGFGKKDLWAEGRKTVMNQANQWISQYRGT